MIDEKKITTILKWLKKQKLEARRMQKLEAVQKNKSMFVAQHATESAYQNTIDFIKNLI